MTDQEARRYVLFDRATGKILATHSVYDAETRSYRTPTAEEARDVFSGLMQGKTADQVDMIEADLPTARDQTGYQVDVKQRQLVPKMKLRIQAGRAQIQGNGQDSVEIDISVVDSHDKPVEDFDGDLRVTTTRGRLSASGGRLKAERGHAKIVLVSAAETVDRVFVTVRDPSGQLAPGTFRLEFL